MSVWQFSRNVPMCCFRFSPGARTHPTLKVYSHQMTPSQTLHWRAKWVYNPFCPPQCLSKRSKVPPVNAMLTVTELFGVNRPLRMLVFVWINGQVADPKPGWMVVGKLCDCYWRPSTSTFNPPLPFLRSAIYIWKSLIKHWCKRTAWIVVLSNAVRVCSHKAKESTWIVSVWSLTSQTGVSKPQAGLMKGVNISIKLLCVQKCQHCHICVWQKNPLIPTHTWNASIVNNSGNVLCVYTHAPTMCNNQSVALWSTFFNRENLQLPLDWPSLIYCLIGSDNL